jgi:3-dehydroquinate synthase
MSTIARTIRVQFDHRVHFTRGLFAPSNSLLQTVLAQPGRLPKVLVVLDEGLAQARPDLIGAIETYFASLRDQLALVGPPLIIEGGERAKMSYFHVSEIHSQIERHHIDRHSCVVGIGGGALLDVAGLAAATAHRGVRHVRVPTTVLGQNDSGVGVKNGINAFGKKNFIGTFTPPFAVINDFDLLATLPERDQRAGFAEAVKVALVRDGAFFESLEADADLLTSFEPGAMERMIYRSAALHVEHIANGGDPFEMGSARPLDFGHWAAHKLEQLSDYQIRHGEAVAIGMALDVIYSRNIGLLDGASVGRILALLRKLGLELFANELLHLDADQQPMVLKGLEEFREHLGGQLTLTMLRGIGAGIEVHEVVLPKMLEALAELQQHHSRTNIVALPKAVLGDSRGH